MNKGEKAYHAALYMRLSREDGLRESSSIATQRKMLRAFAKEHGFSVYGEYADDGYSGTNFDRPQWQRMIEDIEAGRVNLVITKDLSRLGRDYIAAGRYTEIYFPAKGVRYIAVNDGYDSEQEDTDIAPFKNVINEMYARDTSRKIRSAFRTKRKEGAFIGNFAPYGYRKDPEDKNHLLPDPEAAEVVREMFRLADRGDSPAQIADVFNEKGILTPALYRSRNRPDLTPCGCSVRGEWTSSMVCKMLGNQVYLGCVVQGKTEKPTLKSKKTLAKPKEAWTVVPGRHEALVTEEVFHRVMRRRVSRRRQPKNGFQNAFSGIARCGDCGRGMSTAASRSGCYALVCGGYKRYGIRECGSHRISYENLWEIMGREFRELLSLSEEEKKELKVCLKQRNTEQAGRSRKTQEKQLRRREAELDGIIRHLYEDRESGKLDEPRFYKLLDGYEAEQKTVTARRKALAEKDNGGNREIESGDIFSWLDEALRGEDPSFSLLHRLVERIEVCQGEPGADGRCTQVIRIFYGWKEEERDIARRRFPSTCAWALDATPPASSGAGSSTLPENG
ncbi:recombinase family protein [Cuneatibacter sp. NSJ-177]|uniref:recombinase family protein n=1 Tax=Cuneatibacter sp. NSJ-177 TaxID=2931401 RepID=UPI002ED18425